MAGWKNAQDGSWTDPAAWDTGAVPASSDAVMLGLASGYRVTLNGAVGQAQSVSIVNGSAQLVVINAATLGIAGDLGVTGFLGLDSDGYTQEGGSSITVGGTLTDSGSVAVGSGTGGLSADATLTVGQWAGSGSLTLTGSTHRAAVLVQSAAPSVLAGSVTLGGDALLQYAGGSIGSIAASTTLRIGGSQAFVADAAAPGSNSALLGLTGVAGTLVLMNGAEVITNGDLLSTGAIGVDSDGYSGEGGSHLGVAGTLTNTGSLAIGPYTNDLSADTTVTVGQYAGGGSLGLYGSSASQATLNVLSAAPGTLTGTTTLRTHALLEFASGSIATVASGVTLALGGPTARIADASDTTSNSALAGLSENDGTFSLNSGGSAALSGDLLNTGTLLIDGDGYTAEGGSRFSVAGTLTNGGSLVIGPYTNSLSADTTVTAGQYAGTGTLGIYGSGTSQATLTVLSAAPGTLTGTTTLRTHALLEFASGSIATVASGVTLALGGPTARIADASDTTSNSALTGLSENDGTFSLNSGGSAALSGDLLNTGTLLIDGDGYTAEGGSRFSVAGTLTNGGSLVIGPYTNSLSADTTVTAGQYAGTGTLGIYGSSTSQATLTVLSAAPGTLTGTTTLRTHALLEFASGQIGAIAAGSTLALIGPTARIADASDTTGNSALAGLTENDGTLNIQRGNSLSVSGSLANTGTLLVDGDGYSGEGGASLTVAGTLTNAGSVAIGPYTNDLSADTTVTVGQYAGGGSLGLYGSGTSQATLNVLSAAPGTLTGTTTLSGRALLQYASGQVNSIAAGAALSLNGAAARVADIAAPGSSSALTGLTEIDGTLRLLYGATLTVAGGLTNTGLLDLDGDAYTSEGGSSLTVSGLVTNDGTIALGPATATLSGATALTVDRLANFGTIALYGNGTTATGTLLVRGAAENDGTLTIGAASVLRTTGPFTQAAGQTRVQGTLDGAASIAGGTLEVDAGGSVTGGVSFAGTSGTLALGVGAAAGPIAGFLAGDQVELLGETVSQIDKSVANGVSTLAITLADRTVRTLTLAGDYSAATFTLQQSGGNAFIGTSAAGGTPSAAAFTRLGGAGSLSLLADGTWVLDLGTTTLNGAALTASLGVLNAAAAPADWLGGSFTVTGPAVFANAGFDAFSTVPAGAADTGQSVTLGSGQVGSFTETIVLTPVDQRTDGTSASESPVTLLVRGSVVAQPPPLPPPTPTGVLWGDVHVITYDGLAYDFQAAGEFVVARSTVPGDTFQVQARLQPWGAASSVSVMTAVGAAIGGDRVTFQLGRSDFVQVDGAAAGLSAAAPTLALGSGTLRLAAPGLYVLSWTSGQTLTVQQAGDHLDISLALAQGQPGGSVQGILGSDIGQADAFALPDGTVLPQPLASAQLYGAFADAWRVTQASSLLDYAAGQTTGGFSDVSFPADAAQLAALPAEVQAAGRLAAAAANVGNPVIAADAALDYLATGSAGFLASAGFAQAVGVDPAAAAVAAPAPAPALGVSAPVPTVTEAQGAPTSVGFTLYLTAAAAQDTVVSWAVTAPGAGYLGAAAFGGTLPSGTAVIAAGQTSTSVTLSVPATAFGTDPTDALQLTVAAAATPLFAPTAQVTLVNPNPLPGLPAAAQIALVAGRGTLTQAGSGYTLDLGTVQQGTGPDTVQIGIVNTGAAGADSLAGRFALSGDAAFTLANFTDFGPVAGQSANTAPHISLSTDAAGTFTETIVLSAQDINGTGYSAALPQQTLTVTGRVAALPAPVISAPATLAGYLNLPVQLTPLSVSDPNAPDETMTVVVSVLNGTLSTQQTGAYGLSGNGTDRLTLTGAQDAINAALVALTYRAAAAGSDTLTLSVTDADRAAAARTVAIADDIMPNTGAVLVGPRNQVYLGAESGLAGYRLVDPYDQAKGTVLSVTFSNTVGTLSVKGPTGAGAATVTGAGSDTITITGTVDQINAQLADDLTEFVLGPGLGILNDYRHQLNYAVISALITGQTALDPYPGPQDEDLIAVAGPEAKAFLLGVTAASFALNAVSAYAVGGTPPSLANLQRALWVIVADAHIVTESGTIYDFNPVGEFVLAASLQDSDTFMVQARLQAVPGSLSASMMTQVAASIGTDRVTFDAGRAGTVWVNGAAVPLSLNNPYELSGGTLLQVSADTWKLQWNTGETLSVTDGGIFLSAQVAAGPNNTESTFYGLEHLSTDSADDFVLPDGTVLSTPLTQADIALLANAYRVPAAYSLLDYGPGESTATYTDATYPRVVLDLDGLPADVLARAQGVAQAAGITDAGVLRAAEFDYIASGGDMRFVYADASLLAGVSTAAANVAPGTAVPAIGVSPTATRTQLSSTGPTTLHFEAFLTAAAAADSAIAWSLVNGGAGYLNPGAFGTAIPSGTVTIAAGQTTADIAVTIPQGAMGTDATDGLEIGVSSPGGVPVVVGTAQTTLTQPVPGPPPVPVLVDLVNLGTFTRGADGNWSLDLGDIQYGQPLPALQFGIINQAAAGSDELSGTLSASAVDGFTVTGLALPGALAAGQSYYGIGVTLDYTKFGANSETITFNGLDVNGTGYDVALPAQTLTITANVVAPSMVFSKAWGDVHITTYNNLEYDFQAVGEFTLAKSRVDGDSFDIQLRLTPYYNWIAFANVSVIQEVGVSLGADRITFDCSRDGVVWIDGAPAALSDTAPVLSLAAGTVTQLSSTVWKVQWNSGEEATVTDWGSHLDVSDGIPLASPNTVGGLQGEDAGQANDFQLSDGTVLPQPLSYATLYGPYADAWRITDASSLLDYAPGQTTASFTDRGYPANVFSPSALPANVQAQAAAAVAAAGITDPGLAAAAALDYLATGDATFIASTAAVQAQVGGTTRFVPTGIPAAPPMVGVAPDVPGLVAQASGATTVTFDVYLTVALASDLSVAYQVVVPGAGYLGAAELGGALPAGTVTVPAGATQAAFTVSVPQGALGSAPSAALEVQIGNDAGVALSVPVAATVIANSQPEPGIAPVPVLSDLTDPANLTGSGTSYVLDLGTFMLGQRASLEQLQLANGAARGSDSLTGVFSAPTGAGFTTVDATLAQALAGGGSYSGLTVTPRTDLAGTHTQVLTFTPTEVNASGYSVALAPITLTITDTVLPAAAVALNTPDTLVFGNVHVGTVEDQGVSVSNTSVTGSLALRIAPEAHGWATVTGSVASLAAGSTDATSIRAGLDTSSAGAKRGTVLLDASSVASDAQASALSATPSIGLFGAVYRLAAARVAPVSTIVHVGDPGTVHLTVANTAAGDGFSENLAAALSAGAGFSVPLGSTGGIAPGGSDSTLTLAADTSQAGVISGMAAVVLQSDGGTGAGSIDGLGVTALGTVQVPVTVTVNNYAAAGLASSGPALTSGSGSGQYVLNLGTVQQGAAFTPVLLSALNTATGQADLLDGSYTLTGAGAFGHTGFAAFTGLAAGGSLTAGTVSLDTGTAGTYSETVVLHPVDENGSGYVGALSDVTVTVLATVAAPGTAQGDVHMSTFSGQHYEFQATGDFVLARSTDPANAFEVQMHAQAVAPWGDAVSLATQIAARVGTDTVRLMAGGGLQVNGVATALPDAAHPTLALDGGTLTLAGAGQYELDWAGGEALDVTDHGLYLDSTMALGPADGPGSVQGLMGSNSGAANDFQLADGTVLPQPLTPEELTGAFADAWRVAPGASLLAAGDMAFLLPDAPRTTLSGSLGAGAPDAPGLVIAGTLAQLDGDWISGLALRDRIDLVGMDSGLTHTFLLPGNELLITDGTHTGFLRLLNPDAGHNFTVSADGAGGTLIG